MGLREKHDRLALDFRKAKRRFILTELDLALTFCHIAMTTDDQFKRRRNVGNAEQALDAANHFLQDGTFPEKKKGVVRQKVSELETLLARLRASRV